MLQPESSPSKVQQQKADRKTQEYWKQVATSGYRIHHLHMDKHIKHLKLIYLLHYYTSRCLVASSNDFTIKDWRYHRWKDTYSNHVWWNVSFVVIESGICGDKTVTLTNSDTIKIITYDISVLFMWTMCIYCFIIKYLNLWFMYDVFIDLFNLSILI